VLSFFEGEQKADEAVEFLEQSQVARDDAIGILVLDESGQVKTNKVGSRSFFKGAGIGAGADPARPDRARRGRRGRARPAAPRNRTRFDARRSG
jgi:hypothetical protein